MQSAASAILIDVNESVAVIRFNRPAARNSLSAAVLNELTDCISRLVAQERVYGIVFSGVNGVFASGADISELAKLDGKTALEFAQSGQSFFQSIAGASQITIAAIDGYCMGGGLDLALACDLRIASPQSTFAHPGAKLGIITGWGGTQRLPQLIGRARALGMFATAASVSAARAYEIGLVSRIAEDPLAAAISLIKQKRGVTPEM